MGTYKDLKVWQKSMSLVQEVYRATSIYPAEEKYGLASQMRRAAVSIPSNIAEGYGRGHDCELVRFLSIAKGSVNELETQLILSHELEFLTATQYKFMEQLNGEISRMLTALIYRRKQGLDTCKTASINS